MPKVPVDVGPRQYRQLMPRVRISAARFSSLLANRNMTPDMVVQRVTTVVRPDDLAATDQDVDFDDLLALAKVFSHPWSSLLIDEPEVLRRGSDNRTFANQNVGLSPQLITELQLADLMLQSAAELFPGGGYEIPKVPKGGWPEERLASEIRSFLGVSVDDQMGAKDGYAAVRLWIAALNRRNVYVSQRSLKDPTVRAFSKVDADQAVIVVSTKDESHPRIFSMLHEYCHVVLHSTGVCDLLDHSDVERYCNKVAAGVLLPPALLSRLWTPGAFSGPDEMADKALQTISGRAHVSQQALLIALRDRGTISQDLYDSMEARRAARRGGGGKKQKGSPTYYTVEINKVGRLYAHRVVDALSEGVIDRQDASVLLGVGEQNIAKYRNALAEGTGADG